MPSETPNSSIWRESETYRGFHCTVWCRKTQLLLCNIWLCGGAGAFFSPTVTPGCQLYHSLCPQAGKSLGMGLEKISTEGSVVITKTVAAMYLTHTRNSILQKQQGLKDKAGAQGHTNGKPAPEGQGRVSVIMVPGEPRTRNVRVWSLPVEHAWVLLLMSENGLFSFWF